MQKSYIGERTESERGISHQRSSRGSSFGVVPVGFLSEFEAAQRWGRAVNTLIGWRTRLSERRVRMPTVLIAGVWCLSYHDILAIESDAGYSWIRPLAQRGKLLPPLREPEPSATTGSQVLMDVVPPVTIAPVQPELPLSTAYGVLTVVEQRRFARFYFDGMVIYAVADDGTAWWADNASTKRWHRITELPQPASDTAPDWRGL